MRLILRQNRHYWGRFSSLPLALFCLLAPKSLSSSPLSLLRKDFFPQVPDKCLGFRFQSYSFLSLLNKVQNGGWSLPASLLSENCLLPPESHTPRHGFPLHVEVFSLELDTCKGKAFLSPK